nr:hypothetical protein [Anaerolineae bacterium]
MNDSLPPNERGDRPSGANGALWGGLALLLIGAYFLAENLGLNIHLEFLENWWAIFILIPGVMILWRVFQAYRAEGSTTSRHWRNQLVMGLLMVFAAVVFLLNLSWSIFWPFLLIIGGLAFLFNATRQRDQ